MIICNVDGCEREVKAKFLCDMHLQRLYRTGNAGKANPSKNESRSKSIFKTKVCNAAGCEKIGVRMGMCEQHLADFNLT